MKNILYIVLLISQVACSSMPDWLNPNNKDYDEDDKEQVEPTDPENDTTIANLDEILAAINLQKKDRPQNMHGKGIKIGICDKGYEGLENSLGKRLPPNLKVVNAPKNDLAKSFHGTKIAELVYAVATGSVAYNRRVKGPELTLFNCNGISNLIFSINDAINRGIDMMVYAQVWETGGNLDGTGFINKHISKAVAAGILWLNASGNYGRTTYFGPLVKNQFGEAKLPYEDRFIRFEVKHAMIPVKITLGWNDFTDDINYRTSQDLDLVVENSSGKELKVATLIQDGIYHGEKEAKYTAHPRESLMLTMMPGTYHVRVKVKSNNFHNASKLWVVIDGEDVEMVDESPEEAILIPADNAGVITVAGSDYPYSSKSSAKPELQTFSKVYFDDGFKAHGTSTAVAIAAGGIAAYMEKSGLLTRMQVLNMINSGDFSKAGAPVRSFALPGVSELWF